MATKRKSRKSSGGRGSAEAIEKRRVARQLNSLLTGGSKQGPKLDGRTEKRRKRLIKELKEGKGGTELKPIDVVAHVDELLQIGETLASLKKQGVKPRKTEPTPDVLEVVERTQQAYSFRPEAWRMLGLQLDASGEAAPTKRRPRAAKSAKTPKKRGSRKRKSG